jgi:fructose transport system permease protein
MQTLPDSQAAPPSGTPRTSASRWQSIPWGALGPWLALFAACTFFTTQSEQFLRAENFALILQQVMVVGTLAIGQTLIILTAGIDLSCGMVMALGGVFMSKLAVDLHWPVPLAMLGCLAVTCAFGWLNGVLVTRVKLPAFIVTLGTMNIAFAITQIYSSAQTVTNLPPGLTALGNTFEIGGTEVAWGSVLMLLLYAVVWRALQDSAPGRHVYAVGNNAEAARLTGIPVQRVLLSVYVLAGFFYGLAAMLSVARTGVGDPQAGQTENLDAITAVVLGGTSLFGGRGILLGSLVGAVIVGVFRNGLTLMGVASVYQTLITGILVILAVAADQMSRKGGRA